MCLLISTLLVMISTNDHMQSCIGIARVSNLPSGGAGRRLVVLGDLVAGPIKEHQTKFSVRSLLGTDCRHFF